MQEQKEAVFEFFRISFVADGHSPPNMRLTIIGETTSTFSANGYDSRTGATT